MVRAPVLKRGDSTGKRSGQIWLPLGLAFPSHIAISDGEWLKVIGCGAVCCAEGQGDQEEESCVLRSEFSTLEHVGMETLSSEAVDF